MAAPAGLPDPDTLEVFAYDDIARDEMVDIVSADNTHPRVIYDYVLDPVDCKYSTCSTLNSLHTCLP